MPKVLNKYREPIPSDAVDIMRPGKWGSPFRIEDFNSRDDCVNFYELWASKEPDLIRRAKKELKGKDLVCCCKPKRCHGDFLLIIANEK